MAAKHTPGPWVAKPCDCDPMVNEDGNRYWRIEPAKFHSDAQYLSASGWMLKANAYLMAEAPALRDALEKAIRIIEDAERETYWVSGDPYGDSVTVAFRAILARIDGEE